MPGPFENTGAIKDPTRYGALSMGGRQFTGLWTQRSSYRDADVPYIYGKFYSASRFDSILDGINREITSSLTDKRRPGTTPYNDLTFPAINSYLSWKYIQAGAEIIELIADGQDGVIYNATAGQKTALYTKAAGAGKARSLKVNTELFFGDGVEQKKILRSSLVWTAGASYSPGNFIVDSNGNIQAVVAKLTGFTITNAQVVQAMPVGSTDSQFILIITLSGLAPSIEDGAYASFSGLTTFTSLNGQTLQWYPLPPGYAASIGSSQVGFFFHGPLEASASDTGTMTVQLAQAGTAGGTMPIWATSPGATTTDGGVTWTCFGSAVEDWQIAPPTAAPQISAGAGTRFWTPGFKPPYNYYSVMDPNGNLQVCPLTGLLVRTGQTEPKWSKMFGTLTIDQPSVGSSLLTPANWFNCGVPGSWIASTTYPKWTCVLDPNNNLQVTVTDVGTSNATTSPTWAITVGNTTTDGSVSWVCCGPGSVLQFQTINYSFSYHCIDGSVSTAAPVAAMPNQAIGLPGDYEAILQGPNSTDSQCDLIYIWATVPGQAKLLFLDSIPNPSIGSAANWFYRATQTDYTAPGVLDAFLPAPVANSADPPPVGMTAPAYHLQRIWGIKDNLVVYSGGPDTITGNGNTAFPPLNQIAFASRPIRLHPVTLNTGPGILVFTTSGCQVVVGNGTSTSPFDPIDYEHNVSIANYDAFAVLGTTQYFMESNRKVSSFDPSNGYAEIGFPIGDQFQNVTTGTGYAPTGVLYDPTSTFVTWNLQASGETAMYVADGSVGWFRYSPIAPPESGTMWSVRAAILGGTSAVQSVETAPGTFNLLIGPASSGPILMRDTTGTIWTDDDAGTPTPYASWDAKGVTLLCSTGQVAEIAWIATKSARVGSPPQIGLLMGEIKATAAVPFDILNVTSNDPPDLPESVTVYSHRYSALQNGVTPKSDCLLTKFDYGVQDAGDELLEFAIYGTKDEERKQQ